jgi:hypothetical protein
MPDILPHPRGHPAAGAVDGQGEVQTGVRTTPFPEGASGIQEIVVNVA